MFQTKLIRTLSFVFCLALMPVSASAGDPWLVFDGDDPATSKKPGAGKHIVLVSGDHEYRSEEALPQLGKILSVHHGFKCTVLFAIDEDTGIINPENVENIPGLEALQDADLVVFGLRFRNLVDDQMQRVMDYVEAGRPMIAVRTSTHAFDIPEGRKFASEAWNNDTPGQEGGFGKRVLGETWVAHHGKHGKESTRGVIADETHPIARGIKTGDIWGPTDVYRVNLPLPGDSHVVFKGSILTGMNPADPAVDDKRNDPMMPIGWTKSYNGGRVFVTTMGSADDLPSEGVRRMLVNASYWCLGMDDAIRADSDVSIVGEYEPTPFGFGDFIEGRKPEFYDLKVTASP
ncbi:MAG: ThuA domain-containing protein [Planctomycetota bacterium]